MSTLIFSMLTITTIVSYCFAFCFFKLYNKYRVGFEVLIDYWNYLPEDLMKEVDAKLKRVNL